MEKVKLNSIKIDATINLTARDWQFYDMPGAEQAAAKLNRDVERYLAEGNIADITNALQPYSKFGATDTEGYMVLARILNMLGLNTERIF